MNDRPRKSTRRRSTGGGVGTVRDRSVAQIVQRRSMSPRTFWLHVARLLPGR